MNKVFGFALAALTVAPLAGCLGRDTENNYYGQTGYAQPAYAQPAYGQPAYGQPTYGQPGYVGTPYPGGPAYPQGAPGAVVVPPQPAPYNPHNPPPANANVDTRGWFALGTADVGVNSMPDQIMVNPNQGFRKIMITVDGANIAITQFRITFADGTLYDPKVDATLNEGNRAVVIDLPGRVQAIRRISFRARANKFAGGRAWISAYGR